MPYALYDYVNNQFLYQDNGKLCYTENVLEVPLYEDKQEANEELDFLIENEILTQEYVDDNVYVYIVENPIIELKEDDNIFYAIYSPERYAFYTGNDGYSTELTLHCLFTEAMLENYAMFGDLVYKVCLLGTNVKVLSIKKVYKDFNF